MLAIQLNCLPMDGWAWLELISYGRLRDDPRRPVLEAWNFILGGSKHELTWVRAKHF